MAMTVRLPEELDARLNALAERRHTSKHALLIEAADRFLREEVTTEQAVTIARDVADRYSELMKKLEDA
ncbi:putative transcriptional regulator [Microbacterium foliorum]|uniref:CopG family ribbon-helix-helix protein n=1 Tax=Microbacterium foliorum TaxID=104336 RepID=UPI00209E94F7|nr:ribbon-helix-helix protein, CopG family [Microbacterium foliorum]MCP1428221.1 putative transcriptional regulator [Microbacterium foliorum]